MDIIFIQSACVFLFLTTVITPSASYFITVDAHAEECFYDRAKIGTKMGFIYEITEGGFLDIDVKVIGPDWEILYTGLRESSGKYTFAAYAPGIYNYCFSNKMSTMTPKVVMFTTQLVEPEHEDTGNVSKINDMIRKLTDVLTDAKNEQEYMQVRDRIHRSINDTTNFRVVMWSFFEALFLLAMTYGEIYYIKRFFEVRRIV